MQHLCAYLQRGLVLCIQFRPPLQQVLLPERCLWKTVVSLMLSLQQRVSHASEPETEIVILIDVLMYINVQRRAKKTPESTDITYQLRPQCSPICIPVCRCLNIIDRVKIAKDVSIKTTESAVRCNVTPTRRLPSVSPRVSYDREKRVWTGACMFKCTSDPSFRPGGADIVRVSVSRAASLSARFRAR